MPQLAKLLLPFSTYGFSQEHEAFYQRYYIALFYCIRIRSAWPFWRNGLKRSGASLLSAFVCLDSGEIFFLCPVHYFDANSSRDLRLFGVFKLTCFVSWKLMCLFQRTRFKRENGALGCICVFSNQKVFRSFVFPQWPWSWWLYYFEEMNSFWVCACSEWWDVFCYDVMGNLTAIIRPKS